MSITERQRKILEIVIKEHIDSALPISSKFLEEKYSLGVSPATIRNEMQELIEMGYLYQPHTSAGRVPTDKGYRFFVDLFEKEVFFLDQEIEKEVRKIRREIENEISFMREFTRFLAQTSSTLTVSYLKKEKVIIREGWSFVFNDPEFDDGEMVRHFVSVVSQFENNIEKMLSGENRLYIGEEIPFPSRHDFSIIISPYFSKKKERGVLAILGPKRMHYDKNIQLVNSITRFLRDI